MADKNSNRVLGRIGARVLNGEETRAVTGGIITLTLLSYVPPYGTDGDPHKDVW